MNATILSSAADGVLTLTLNRPDALNAFTVEMKEGLAAFVEKRKPTWKGR